MTATTAVRVALDLSTASTAASANDPLQIVLGFVAVVLATINVVGGFVVTDRMLEMFKGRQAPAKPEQR